MTEVGRLFELHDFQELWTHSFYFFLPFCTSYEWSIIFFPFSLSADVLSEDAIINWYKSGHVPKGKSVFLTQMEKMVEWLQNAEEESSEEEDEEEW